MKKALVAMSGGVDSSVAAYLMKEAGYDVTGVMMKLFDNRMTKHEQDSEPEAEFNVGSAASDNAAADSASDNAAIGNGAADSASYNAPSDSSENDNAATDNTADARMVADKLGIGFDLIDMRPDFREEVIDKFVAAYEKGETPNPCVFCNKRLKFDALYDCGLSSLASRNDCNSECGEAEQYAADRYGGPVVIATGHYAIIEYDEAAGRYKLRKAANPEKDQSYVLYNLTQEQLARTRFPLGALSKEEVRRIAEEQGFVTAHKSESQDICFIPDGDYAGFIRDYTGRDYPPGDFVDADGNVMGEHKGIIKYTIGQRKGLGLALKKPAYVLRLDTERNQVVLGDNEDLFTRELIARDFNWVSMSTPSGPFRASARIRYKHREAPAEIIPLDADGNKKSANDNKKSADDHCVSAVKIIFDEPQRAITRGQSVVVYDGDYVLGGGIIER